MSRTSLNKTIQQIAKRLADPKMSLREGTADKKQQILHMDGLSIYKAIESQLVAKGYTVDRPAITLLIREFQAKVFNNFKTKKNYVSKIEGTPDEFSIFVAQDGATGSVFKLALRQQLNPFLSELERKISELVSAPEEELVRGLPIQGSSAKTRGFLHLGHTTGNSIAFKAGALRLTPAIKKSLNRNYSETLNLFLEKNSFFDNVAFMTLNLESSSENSATGSTAKRERAMIAGLRKALLEVDISDVRGSPSLIEEVKGSIVGAANNKKAKKVNRSSVSTTVKRIETAEQFEFVPSAEIGKREKVSQDWTALLPIINAKLMAATVAQMGEPSLVNRTGRFASSARITGVASTQQGYPSFAMSYDKQPYGVFDRRLGAAPWATPARDPYTIIERALRSILKEYAINRFYVRRT